MIAQIIILYSAFIKPSLFLKKNILIERRKVLLIVISKIKEYVSR